jgi:quinol monooxygenase YgiN
VKKITGMPIHNVTIDEDVPNTPQITIVCFIKSKQKTKHQVKSELSNLAKMTRLEADNMNYDLHISAADDSLFIIYENWRSKTALDTYMSQSYLKDFLAKQEELLEKPVEGNICKIIK